jgi:hypothetical protein
MGMHCKCLTVDCIECGYFKKSINNKFICKWGKTKKGKYLLPPKGKESLKCKLIESK